MSVTACEQAVELCHHDQVHQACELLISQGVSCHEDLAILASQGRGYWSEGAHQLVQLLVANQDHHRAAMYLLALDQPQEAISMYRQAGLWRDALAVASANLLPNDPLQLHLRRAYAAACHAKGLYEAAAANALLAGDPAAAAASLLARGSLVSTRAALELLSILSSQGHGTAITTPGSSPRSSNACRRGCSSPEPPMLLFQCVATCGSLAAGPEQLAQALGPCHGYCSILQQDQGQQEGQQRRTPACTALTAAAAVAGLVSAVAVGLWQSFCQPPEQRADASRAAGDGDRQQDPCSLETAAGGSASADATEGAAWSYAGLLKQLHAEGLSVQGPCAGLLRLALDQASSNRALLQDLQRDRHAATAAAEALLQQVQSGRGGTAGVVLLLEQDEQSLGGSGRVPGAEPSGAEGRTIGSQEGGHQVKEQTTGGLCLEAACCTLLLMLQCLSPELQDPLQTAEGETGASAAVCGCSLAQSWQRIGQLVGEARTLAAQLQQQQQRTQEEGGRTLMARPAVQLQQFQCGSSPRLRYSLAQLLELQGSSSSSSSSRVKQGLPEFLWKEAQGWMRQQPRQPKVASSRRQQQQQRDSSERLQDQLQLQLQQESRHQTELHGQAHCPVREASTGWGCSYSTVELLRMRHSHTAGPAGLPEDVQREFSAAVEQ